MKKKKLVLDWDAESNETKLLGIVSSLQHLEFVHSLNKTDHFNFGRIDDLEIETADAPVFFIQFSFEDSAIEHTYKLIKTKGSAGYMARELKGIDYVLIITSENDDHLNTVSNLLKELPFVQAIIEIDNLRISEKIKKILFI